VALSPSGSRSVAVGTSEPAPFRLTPEGSDAAEALTVVIMAGGFSPPPLAEAASCSPLDLFVSPGETVCSLWVSAVRSLEGTVSVEDMMCVCGGSTPLPTSSMGALRTIADQTDYRGPAGALRDALERRRPDGLVLVAEAARLCFADIRALLASHRSRRAEVTVAALPDGTPAGVYLLQAATLDLVPHKGFMDLKEQWLGKLVAEGRAVFVHEFPAGSCPPIRTREEYIRAILQRHSEFGSAAADAGGPEPRLIVGTHHSRSIICAASDIASSAVVVDSVVMPGAVVGPGALVVRSVVCRDVRVPAGAVVVDAVFGPRGLVKDSGAPARGSAA